MIQTQTQLQNVGTSLTQEQANEKRPYWIGLLACWAVIATAATPLPDAEKHRLASYLAYITVGVETQGPGGGSLYTVGSNCPECNGVGKRW